MKIKAILFDLDNTVWDFSASARQALEAVYSSYLFSHGVEKGQWLSSYYHHNDVLWAKYRQGVLVSATVKTERFARSFSEVGVHVGPDEIIAISSFFLEKIVAGTKLFSGVIKTLTILKPHFNLGVISNGFAVSGDRLQSLGLKHLFEVVVTSEEVGKPKPHPDIFINALQRLSLRPQEAVYVGDDYESDIVGASRVGMRTVWFSCQGQNAQSSIRPDYVITEFSQLQSLFL